MATSVLDIAAQAFTAVNAEITDVINTCSVTKTTRGAYDPQTGNYVTSTSTVTGRALQDTSKPIADIFENYVAGPQDLLFYLEGLASPPAENDVLTVKGEDYKIKRVGDIVGAGSFYSVIASG